MDEYGVLCWPLFFIPRFQVYADIWRSLIPNRTIVESISSGREQKGINSQHTLRFHQFCYTEFEPHLVNQIGCKFSSFSHFFFSIIRTLHFFCVNRKKKIFSWKYPIWHQLRLLFLYITRVPPLPRVPLLPKIEPVAAILSRVSKSLFCFKKGIIKTASEFKTELLVESHTDTRRFDVI